MGMKAPVCIAPIKGEPRQIHGFQNGISPWLQRSARNCFIGTMNRRRSRKTGTSSNDSRGRKADADRSSHRDAYHRRRDLRAMT